VISQCDALVKRPLRQKPYFWGNIDFSGKAVDSLIWLIWALLLNPIKNGNYRFCLKNQMTRFERCFFVAEKDFLRRPKAN